MTTEDLRVAVYRLRTTFGRRRGSYLAIVLLVGLVGGTAMGALVAARRTQSAFSTYLASTNPSDLSVSIYAVSGGASLPYSRSMESEALGLPGVKHVEALIDVSAFPLQPDGVPVLTTATTSSTLTLASIDGLFFNQDRLVATQGRMAVANRPDEMVMSPTAAHVLGFHVGEVIPYGIFTAHQVNLPAFGTPRVRPSLRVQARLVGLVQFNNAVVEDDIDRLPTFVVFTPALAHDIITGPAKGAQEAVSLAFQLKKGNAGVPAVESTLPRVLPADAVYQFHATAPVEQKVDASVKPLTIALAVFGLVAALAALVIGAQVISRQHRFLQEELETLRALGAPPGTLLADGLLGTMGAVLVGSLLAVGVSTALSPLSPLGPVRSVFPGPWVAVDWTVEGLGFVALAVVLGAVAVFVGYRGAPHRVARRSRLASPRTSIAAGVAASSGLPVAATVGLRFALEPGKGRTSVPVRSALVGGSLAVALVVATLTFGSGLRNLVSHPALYGWNWSYILNPTNTVPPKALSLLDKDTDVANWTGYDYNDADIDGQGVPFLFEGTGRPGQSPLSPPILSGHGLEGKDEIVLGAATLALLDKRVGDTVTVSYGQPADAPLYISPTPVRIVGTATMPAVGFSSVVADHTSMGTGALLSTAFLSSGFQQATQSPNPALNGPDLVMVKLRNGVPAASGRANLQQIAAAANRFLASTPGGGGGQATVSVIGVQRPAQIVNYRSMGAAPVVLAGAVAGGAVVALGLILTTSVRRRRHDLAILKTLGFTDRQLASAVAWQASAAAVIGVVVGVVLGIAAGRLLWSLFARQIYAVPDSTVPVLSVVITAILTLVLANAVALLPGRSAARTSTALLLRTE